MNVNPNYIQRSETMERMDLLACGKDGLINMIEVGAKEISEKTLEDGLKTASQEIEKIQAWQKMIVAERGAAINCCISAPALFDRDRSGWTAGAAA